MGFLLGVVGAFVDIALVGYIQVKSEKIYLGKTFSFFSTLANTGESLAGLLAGLLLVYYSSQALGYGFSILCAGSAVLFWIKNRSINIRLDAKGTLERFAE